MLENRIDEDPIADDGKNIGWPNPEAGEIDLWEWYGNSPSSYITNIAPSCNEQASPYVDEDDCTVTTIDQFP